MIGGTRPEGPNGWKGKKVEYPLRGFISLLISHAVEKGRVNSYEG